jgi:hypothetical protein
MATDIEEILQLHAQAIKDAGKENWSVLVDGRPQMASPVPYGEFVETKKILINEIAIARNNEKVLIWLAIALVGFIVWMAYEWHSRQVYDLGSVESPAVAQINGFHVAYLRWGRDHEGRVGWLHCDKAGTPDGTPVVAPSEGNPDIAEPSGP